MIVRVRAPVRIDWTGAWTDCAPFANAFGGATLNASINHYVEGELAIGGGNLKGTQVMTLPGHGTLPVANEQPGLVLRYGMDIPTGSGLGTSATLNVVWLALVGGKAITSREEKMDIAAAAYGIEKVLGIIGGKQDQYASAVGGINLFEFTENEVRCLPVKMATETINELESRLVLCFTGKPRLSSNIHDNVWGNFRKGRRETVDALFTLRDSAYRGKEMLEQGRLGQFGPLLTLQFESMKHLDSSTSNAQIDGLFELVKDDISGGKPMGAGGGGCILFCCKNAKKKARVTRKIGQQAGISVIPFELEFSGLQVAVTKRPH